jgi:Dyp-type peroxidase family
MRAELIFKTRTLAGVSDLTIAAPLRKGLVPSLDAVSYRTRARSVMRVLNSSRSSSQEYALLRPFSDSVERVGGIHSVRIALIGDTVMLAATFDGNFDAYIRVLYQKVATLLDLIFCNTEGHRGCQVASFEQWRDWVYSRQVETDLFYSHPGLTFDDVQYLREAERRHRGRADDDLDATRQRLQTPEMLAWEAVRRPPLRPSSGPTPLPTGTLETLKQGLQALSVLYRLADLYLPGTEDGELLQRAARYLLLELNQLDTRKLLPADNPVTAPVRARFAKQLAWFEAQLPQPPRPAPPAPTLDLRDVQGGILGSYPAQVTHGCLLLLHVDNAAAGAKLLSDLLPQLWCHADELPEDPSQKVLTTVAVSAEGLRALGLGDDDLERFPRDFREGMEARCSVLGDVRINHPRRWRLPERNWPKAGDARVPLQAVHLVVQMRTAGAPGSELQDDVSHSGHPLHAAVQALMNPGGVARAGVQLLSVQAMRRASDPGKPVSEHFGFVDGLSDPQIGRTPAAYARYDNRVPLGELLLGHANQVDAAPELKHPWLFNGSFLVVRKLRQDVERYHQVVHRAAAATGLDAALIQAKMMGRHPNGEPLVGRQGPGPNDFDYQADPQGDRCPFQAHVRRVNPREPLGLHQPPGRRVPRIMRRGMSYGLRADQAPQVSERGMIFMAYNASIAEQFEVLQRWLSGGNSSGVLSAQSDPFCGVPTVGDARVFRFSEGGQVHRVALDDAGTGAEHDGPAPLVRLEWGMYLFAPSISALKALRDRAATVVATPSGLPWSASDGLRLLDRLQAEAEADPPCAVALWKAALEDPDERRYFRSASIWAAIREHRGGVLRTPYGVLVADPQRVMEVFTNAHDRYTMQQHRDERMAPSIGEIYLGLDAGPGYKAQADASNRAIRALTMDDGFQLAHKATRTFLQGAIEATRQQAIHFGLPSWELNLDIKEVSDFMLEQACRAWLGLPTPATPQFQGGGYRWDWKPGQPPLIPGHLTAPSRFIFQPQPGVDVCRIGMEYGRALRQAALAHVKALRDAGSMPDAALAKAIFAAFPARGDDDLVARTLVGTLMGMLPTVDGNLRSTLNEWLQDGSFWRLRETLRDLPALPTLTDAAARLRTPLYRSMQLRPMPELVWRTVAPGKTHALGPVEVRPGDRIVVAIVSAMQQKLAAGAADVFPVFGGDRGAATAPLHACPGYAVGMGLLLGTVCAMLQAPGDLRSSPVPLSLTFVGPTP